MKSAFQLTILLVALTVTTSSPVPDPSPNFVGLKYYIYTAPKEFLDSYFAKPATDKVELADKKVTPVVAPASPAVEEKQEKDVKENEKDLPPAVVEELPAEKVPDTGNKVEDVVKISEDDGEGKEVLIAIA